MTANEPSRKAKVIVFATAGSVLLTVLVSAVALEVGGLPLLHWATTHPAAWAKYDPHHWVSRLLALCVLLSLGHAVLLALHDYWVKITIWRRVFLPWRREKQAEPEQPSLETLK